MDKYDLSLYIQTSKFPDVHLIVSAKTMHWNTHTDPLQDNKAQDTCKTTCAGTLARRFAMYV